MVKINRRLPALPAKGEYDKTMPVILAETGKDLSLPKTLTSKLEVTLSRLILCSSSIWLSPLSSRSSAWQKAWFPAPTKSLAVWLQMKKSLPKPYSRSCSPVPQWKTCRVSLPGQAPSPLRETLLVNAGRETKIKDAILRFMWLYTNQTMLQVSHFAPLRGLLCNPKAIFSHLCRKLHSKLPMDLLKKV